MKKDRPVISNFMMAADLPPFSYKAPAEPPAAARETAATKSPVYRRDHREPTEQDLQALSKRKECFPDLPPDVA